MYFQQVIQSAYLCGSIIQLHYHPYEAEDGTEYDHETNIHDMKRLEARLTEIDNHLEAWYKAIPPVFQPDWGQSTGDEGDTTGFQPASSSQFFIAGGDWWWRHATGGMLEMNYLARKFFLICVIFISQLTPLSGTDCVLPCKPSQATSSSASACSIENTLTCVAPPTSSIR